MKTQWIIVIYWDEYRDGHGLAVIDRGKIHIQGRTLSPIAQLDPYDLEDIQARLSDMYDRWDAYPNYVEYYYEDEDGDECEQSSSYVIIPYTLQAYYRNKYFSYVKLPKQGEWYDLKRRQAG